MYSHLKRILFFLLFSLLYLPFYSQTIPLTVPEARFVFEDINKKIQKIMPRGVEVFLYSPYIINASENDKKIFEDIIPEFFVNSAEKLDFKIITMNMLKRKNPSIAQSIAESAGQDEIMWAAKEMQYDAVLMINIGKAGNNIRNVWSNKKKAFSKKDVYLLQANIFNPEDSTVYSRFSAFFFLED
jgi:hypothetical protein